MNVETIIIPFEEELLPVTKLHSGRISCVYEHGRLRYMKYGETEVIRMIYFAVRDKNWETAPYKIENEIIKRSDNAFFISYTAIHNLNEITYCTEVFIEAKENTITFRAKGEALSSFKRNRIGLCVHHPVKECKGKGVNILRTDGTTYHSQFPDLIKPYQPFTNIKKMNYQIGEGIRADLIFEGDVFETEDQRNWADSSYKTYSTPLDIPFPVQVNFGEKMEQRLEVTIFGEVLKEEVKESSADERKIAFPNIGYSRNNNDPLRNDEVLLMHQIPFDHYRIELHFQSSHWEQQFFQSLAEALVLETRLEIALFFDADFQKQLKDFLVLLKKNSSAVSSVLVLHIDHAATPDNLMQLVYTEIKQSCPHISVGYGTDQFFAALNRNRPGGMDLDFVCFSLCPQVHASDTRSLIENLERQADLITAVRSFAPGKKIHISPITFTIRSGKEPEQDYDPRLHRWLGALWTLVAIKNLGEADHLTFYEVKGYRGILYNEALNADNSPLYKMLQIIRSFKPRWIIDNNSGKIQVDNMMFENDLGNRLEFIIDRSTLESQNVLKV